MWPTEPYCPARGTACGSQTNPACHVQHMPNPALHTACSAWSWSGMKHFTGCMLCGWLVQGAGQSGAYAECDTHAQPTLHAVSMAKLDQNY